MTTPLLVAVAFTASAANGATTRTFTVANQAEVVATITASCTPCEWSAAGREAAVLELALDGTYSQHLVLTRGHASAPYPVMLGVLRAGRHQLLIRRDSARSAQQSDGTERHPGTSSRCAFGRSNVRRVIPHRLMSRATHGWCCVA